MLIKNRDDRTATVLLHDVHGEYTQCLTDLPMYDPAAEAKTETHVRCEVIWDSYALKFTLSDLGIQDSETKVQQAYQLLFGNDLESLIEGLDAPYAIWKVTGTHKGLDRAFRALRDSLMPTLNDGGSITQPFWQPSGDDDVYDYWPNTMDMLWDFAQNLDTISDDDSHRRMVWEIMDTMRAIGRWDDLLPKGDNAFEWNASARWGYEA